MHHNIVISLMIATIFVGTYIAFLFPWDGDRKPKLNKFAGAGVSEKPKKPEQYNNKD